MKNVLSFCALLITVSHFEFLWAHDVRHRLCEGELADQTSVVPQIVDGRMFWKGRLVALSPGSSPVSWKVVEVLVKNRDSVMGYEDIANRVWDDVEEASLRVDLRKRIRAPIEHVRSAFREVDPEFDHIQSYYGSGYAWLTGLANEQSGQGVHWNSDLRTVVWKGTTVRLNDVELQVLLRLLERPGEICAYRDFSELFQSHGNEEEMRRQLHWTIGTLRSVFQSIDPEFDKISAIRNTGYVWQSNQWDISNGVLVNPRSRQVLWKGRPLSLGPQHFDLLMALLDKAGTPLAKKDLVKRYWPEITLSDRGERQKGMGRLRTTLRLLYLAFREIDPGFGSLKSDENGIFWSSPGEISASVIGEERPRILWRGVDIPMFNNDDITFLLSILYRPNAVVYHYELRDILFPRGSWRYHSHYAEQINRVANRVIAKFIARDPEFNRIRLIKGVGYIWDNGERNWMRVGAAEFSDDAYEFRWNSVPVKLSLEQFRMARKFLDSYSKPVTDEDLYDAYAGDWRKQMLANRASEKGRPLRIEVKARRQRLTEAVSGLRRALLAVDSQFTAIRLESDSGSRYLWEEN